MKMKKLTALALAGVLCLGMSTVALAAPSVGDEQAISAVNKRGDEVKLNKQDVDEWYTRVWNPTKNDWDYVRRDTLRGTFYDGWDAADPEDASEAIKESFRKASNELEDAITAWELEHDSKDSGMIEELKKQQATFDNLRNSNVLIEVATLVDLTPVDGMDGVVNERNPITVKFVLDKRLKDLKVGQQIRVMHKNKATGCWEIYENSVQWDSDNSQFYIEQTLTDLSPVAILRVTSDGTVTPVDPVDPTDPTDPVVKPDANGQITADQLAELIAQRLQTNNVKFDRTAVSGKASPKTGE